MPSLKHYLKVGVYNDLLPNQTLEADLSVEKEIREAAKMKNVILSDFNYPLIDWANVCSFMP